MSAQSHSAGPGDIGAPAPARDYYQFEDVSQAMLGLFRQAQESDGRAGTVLDIGCGRARLGLELERLGFRVTGVEQSPVARDAARGRITELIEADLLDFERASAALGGRRFEWLVASEVLEHLPNPSEALRFYRRFLRADGRLVLSLPNVAVWDNRLRVLFGHFNYTDSGVLDRTHLRFFTFRSARQLVLAAGFAITRASYDPGIARAFLPALKRALGDNKKPDAILESDSYRFYARYILPVETLICRPTPGLLAHRIVLLARRNDLPSDSQ